MKKEKGTMKQLFKKMAVIFLMVVIAFSVIPATVQAAGWKQNKNGYWWQENDYSYPKNQWKTIYEKQYHFNFDGYMDTGWKKIDGKWYYLGSKNDGAKKTYWQKVYGKYYWLGRDGAMRTGWQKVYGKYYWLGHSNDGAMKTGWQKVYGKYYWLGHSNDGAMKIGWQTVYGKKYYLGGANDGAMKTGWQQIDGYWYYFGGADDGSLKTNTWIGNYYVDGNGRWDTHKSIDISEYMLNEKYKNLVQDLGMTLKEDYSHKGYKYAKDKISLFWWDPTYSIENYGTKFVNVYGITIGDSLIKARTILSSKGWTNVKGYSNYKYNYVYLKKIDGVRYMIEFDTDSKGILQYWQLMNWSQGEWIPEEFRHSSQSINEEDIQQKLNVMENPDESVDFETIEAPDTSGEIGVDSIQNEAEPDKETEDLEEADKQQIANEQTTDSVEENTEETDVDKELEGEQEDTNQGEQENSKVE